MQYWSTTRRKCIFVTIPTSENFDDWVNFLKIGYNTSVLYNDGTVIMSEHKNDLQNAFDIYEAYCNL